MTTVYISYSHQNSDIVRHIVDDLQAAGLRVLIDYLVIRGGESWEPQMRQAMYEADALLVMVSPGTLRSRYMGAEIAIFQEAQKPIFPVWVDGAGWTSLAPLSLVTHQYIDAKGGRYQQGIDELIATLARQFPPSDPAISILVEAGFSPRYIKAFERLLNHPLQRPEDCLLLYLSETISLQTALELERQLNEIYRLALLHTPDLTGTLKHRHPDFDVNAPMIRIRSFTDPGSSELIVALTAAAASIAADPVAQTIFLGLVTNALWDAIKSAGSGLKVGLRRNKSGVEKDETPAGHSTPTPLTQTTRHFVEEVRQTHSFVIFQGKELIFGIEENVTRREEMQIEVITH